jgi:hypothetical protein
MAADAKGAVWNGAIFALLNGAIERKSVTWGINKNAH